MALTELQIPDKIQFKNNIQRVAGEVMRGCTSWQQVSDFMNRMDAADLTAVGIIDAAEIADLTAFRSAVSEIVATYEANKDAFKKINKMMIF